MKINEVEELLQVSKANIRYYEKEGLLSPKRAGDGYRIYSEEDIEILRRIIVLRKMDMSIADIKDMFAGEISMSQALAKTIEHLEIEIEKLNGSMKLARTMEQNEKNKTEFDVQYYWNWMQEEETEGFHFADIMSDYIEMEKAALVAMLENVFFIPFGRITAKKGWLIGLLIFLAFAAIRGVSEIVLRSGDFLNGFGYPFFLLAAVSALIFPLCVMDYKYQNRPLTKVKKTPIWVTFFKVVGCILYFPFVLLGGLWVGETFITSHLIQEEYWVANGWLWPLYMYGGLFLFVVLVWMYSKKGLFANGIDTEPFQCHLPAEKKKKYLAGSILVYLLSLICYSASFDCFTMEGVEHRVLFYSKSYTWEDVDYYTLDSEHDLLCYKIVMKDGFESDCMGDAIALYSLPEEEFPNDVEDYAICLTKMFMEKGISLKNTDWEELKKDLKYDYLVDYVEELRKLTEG